MHILCPKQDAIPEGFISTQDFAREHGEDPEVMSHRVRRLGRQGIVDTVLLKRHTGETGRLTPILFFKPKERAKWPAPNRACPSPK